MVSGFIYKVPLVCFAQVGGWFGFVLFFAPIALDKNHRPFQLLNPPCTARSIPGKVHLLWETKSWGRQTAAAAQPCCPIPHPGEGTSPLRGYDLAQDVPSAPSRERKMPFPAPSGSLLHSNQPPGARGWALTPSHEPKCDCVLLSWRKTPAIQMGARIVSWRYFTVNLNGLGIVKLSHLF